MNRFGNKPFGTEYDPDKELAAQELNARADKMIEAGLITAAERDGCFSLADLRKLVEKHAETYRKLVEIRAYLGIELFQEWIAASTQETPFEQYVDAEYQKMTHHREDALRDMDWQAQTEDLRHGG